MSITPTRESLDIETKGDISSIDDFSTIQRSSASFTSLTNNPNTTNTLASNSHYDLKKLSLSLTPQPEEPEDQLQQPQGPSDRSDVSTTLHQSTSDPDDSDDSASKIHFIHWFITNWLIMDPNLLHLENKTKAPKNYQIEQDSTKKIYLLGGRLQINKNNKYPVNLFTLVLIIIPNIFFYIYEAKWHWEHISPAIDITYSYVLLNVVIIFIRLSAGQDPGKLPKNLHIPKQPSSVNRRIDDPPDEYFNTITLPYYKTNKDGVQVKYCNTCHIWRPIRTSHCGVCNACVLNHDHHCIFLNNCIGQRNYKYFLWFLLGIFVCCVYLLTMSIVKLSINEKNRIWENRVSLFLIIYVGLAMVYPLLLLLFHVFLTCQNITTREYLNYVYKRKKNNYVNVFNTGNVFDNLYINWLGKSSGISLTSLRDVYKTDDIRFRKIEPLSSFN